MPQKFFEQSGEKPGVSGLGETYSPVEKGSPWDPEVLTTKKLLRTPFQERLDSLMAEAEGQVGIYTTELKPDETWDVTVIEASTSPAVETTTSVAGMQEKVVVTQSSPFGVSEIKSEKQETVISAAGTIFDKDAQPQKVNQAETGAQDHREHKN